MNKVTLAVLVFAAAVFAQNKPGPADLDSNTWKLPQFLVGTWEAKTKGGSAGAASTGSYSFQLELKNHILSRRSYSSECSGPKDFNCDHSDLLYIYPESQGGPLKAVFFDNEGHVIHYDVSTPAATSAVFVSDSAPKGPQYRLSYELKGEELFGKFEIRLPGQSEFKAYLEWSGKKKQAP